MIDLYTWSTPNGYKVSMMLEEVGLPYTVQPIDLGQQQQSTPEFLAISPNGRIPAIVDDGFAVFDSGAILIYLAEKTGQLLPTDTQQRSKVLQWLMFQMAHVGPMIGQLAWFTRSAEEHVPFAINRYMQESVRLMRVLNEQLADSEFIAGDFSIADIANFPWVNLVLDLLKAQSADSLGEVPHLERWNTLIAARPSAIKGMSVPAKFE